MQTVTEILIDYSSSMNGDKINICKRLLLEEVIPIIDYSSRIGVKTFTASVDYVPSIIVHQGLKVTNKEELTQAISSLNSPDGNTPIAHAIKSSVESLKEYRAFKKKIILITDGEENCNGDYEAEAKKAQIEGIECEIHIIGLGLKPAEVRKAKRITNATGGTFSNLSTSTYVAYNSGVVKDALITLTKAVGKISATSHTTTIKTTTTNTFSPKEQHSNPSNNSNKKLTSDTSFTKSEKANVDKMQDNDSENQNNNKNLVDAVHYSDNTELMKIILENSTVLNEVKGTLKKLNKEIKEIKDKGIKINYQEDDENVLITEDKELNENIRLASEMFVCKLLRNKYGERVKWLNENGESGESHDFEVIDLDDSIEYYVECKGTSSSEKSFLMTKKEWRLFLNQTKNYQIFFVTEALTEPKLLKIDNLLDWILKGKIVPYSQKNIKLKAERVVLSILD